MLAASLWTALAIQVAFAIRIRHTSFNFRATPLPTPFLPPSCHSPTLTTPPISADLTLCDAILSQSKCIFSQNNQIIHQGNHIYNLIFQCGRVVRVRQFLFYKFSLYRIHSKRNTQSLQFVQHIEQKMTISVYSIEQKSRKSFSS